MKISNLAAIVFFCMAAFLCPSVNVFGQNDKNDETETLFGRGNLRISGFGAPIVEFSSVNGQFSVSNGGGGAALFNQTFFIGGYGVGLSNRVAFNTSASQRLDFGHGGFWVGYVSSPKKLVHFTGSMKLGWGNVNVRNTNFNSNMAILSNTAFVGTPEVGFEINITRFFKITATAGYRFVTGINSLDFTNGQGNITETLSNSDFNSPMGSLTFKFGWFK